MPKKGIFRSFEEARIFAHSLKLKNIGAWQEWAKTDARPFDIPLAPHMTIDWEMVLFVWMIFSASLSYSSRRLLWAKCSF